MWTDRRGPRPEPSRFAPVVAAGLLVISIGCSGPPSLEGPARHVVLISLDTTRVDHFGFYGNPTVRTPNLDALAAESIVFDDFMTVVTTTLASHVSTFTGNYAHTHGVPRNGFVVSDRNLMLPEILADHGFETAGFIGAFPLSDRFGFAQGFDHYDEQFEIEKGGEYQSAERSADQVNSAIIEWLDREGVPEHLFLFAHYFDPHAPYEAPPPYDTFYDPRGRQDLPPMSEIQKTCKESESPEAIARAELQYASEISYLDDRVGRLLDALRERGIFDDALIVITSDHGEYFNEHPPWGFCFDHGWMNYQVTTRSVGMIRLPGGESGGRRIPELAATIDILPTILTYLGIAVPDRVEGQVADLVGTTSGLTGARYCEATKPWEHQETDPRWRNLLKAHSIRDGRHKFVQVPYARYAEMYDVEADPGERANLLENVDPETLELARRLREKLRGWALSASPLPSCFLCEDQEALERLKALGYLGGDDLPDHCCAD